MLLAPAISLVALPFVVASCASDTSSLSRDEGDASVVPESSTSDTGSIGDPDAAQDAGCDAADPSCTTHVASCADVAFCAVTTNVSPFFVLKAVWGSGPNDVWIAGSGGTIAHFDGSTWVPTPSTLRNTFNAIWGSGPNDVWVVSGNTAIVHSTGFDAGKATWTAMPASVDEFVVSSIETVWGSSASDVRVGGSSFDYFDPNANAYLTGDQFVLSADDVGAPIWNPVAGTATIRRIWGSSASDVWMVGDNSANVAWQTALTLHGTPGEDGQLSFVEVDSQSSDLLEGLHGSSADDVWAVGSGGAIRHVASGDERWQIVASPTTASLHGVFAVAPNDVWAVGEVGTILHYDGVKFTEVSAEFPIGKKPTLYGVWASGPDDVWIVGDAITLHYTGPKGGAQ